MFGVESWLENIKQKLVNNFYERLIKFQLSQESIFYKLLRTQRIKLLYELTLDNNMKG